MKTPWITQWTHKMEEWRRIPILPYEISNLGRLRSRTYGHTYIRSPNIIGANVNYVLRYNKLLYLLNAKNYVADAFIPGAPGTFVSAKERYDVALWGLTRSIPGVCQEVARYWWMVTRDPSFMKILYSLSLETLAADFGFPVDFVDNVIRMPQEELDGFPTAFDKLTHYSTFADQYYRPVVWWFNRIGLPKPVVYFHKNSPWLRTQLSFQAVHENPRQARIEWSREVSKRAPHLWCGTIPEDQRVVEGDGL